MKFRVALIAALAPNMGIGEGDRLPWKMPRDMKFFRLTTRGHVVIMGRKTFESFGCRALPHRTNIVLSRTKTFPGKDVAVMRSMEEAIDLALHVTSKSRLFVIGGGNVYRQAIEFADEMYLTMVESVEATVPLFGKDSFQADTFFPEFSDREWTTCHVSRSYKALDSLRAPRDVHSTLYFKFWKLARRSVGCSPTERGRLVQRFGTDQLELPFWDREKMRPYLSDSAAR